jgi:hypothetical protein
MKVYEWRRTITLNNQQHERSSMIFHKLEQVKNGDKIEYKIDLVERNYLWNRKMITVLSGITDEEQGEVLVEVMQKGFDNGVKAASMKIGQEIKV